MMKPPISDRQQTQKPVSLWTPWGVQHCVRDDEAPGQLRKLQASRWSSSAAARLSGHKPDYLRQR